MAELNPQLLKKAGEMGIIKGKTLGGIKRQIIKSSETREQGLKKFKNVERVIINPTASKTAGQLKSALGVLKEAGVLKSAYGGQPQTLLERAKANIAAADRKEAEAEKEKMRGRTLKGRLEEEGVTGAGGRGFLEKIEKESAAKESAAKVLEEAKKREVSDHAVSVFENKAPSPPPPVEL